MAGKRRLTAQLDELSERLSAIEDLHESTGHLADVVPSELDRALNYCGVPERPEREFAPDISADRVAAIVAIGRKWVNKTELRYWMFEDGRFGGGADQQTVVERAFQTWADLELGIGFRRTMHASEAELRIGFMRGDGSWSYIGTDALGVGQQERTMNFGWDINVPGPNGNDTAVHEVGHALGFQHEHQNPHSGIVWDEAAVYQYFAITQEPPWSRAKTDHNILNTIDPPTVDGTTWDRDSVMHYAFAAGLILQPEELRPGLRPAPGLAAKDIELARRFYPPLPEVDARRVLEPWQSELLELAPGEQADFRVEPTETRDYEFRTFGASDTVMVLFEENEDGEFRYVEGDDDSGWDRNASFRVRLIKGHRYELRIRLYYQSSTGSTAVMMW